MTHDYNLGWILVNYAAAFICRVREGREYISMHVMILEKSFSKY